MTNPPRQPVDTFLDRILPDADSETRERARVMLRAYALALLERGERAVSGALGPDDSPDLIGRPIL